MLMYFEYRNLNLDTRLPVEKGRQLPDPDSKSSRRDTKTSACEFSVGRLALYTDPHLSLDSRANPAPWRWGIG